MPTIVSQVLVSTLFSVLKLLKFGPVAQILSMLLDHFSSALGHWILLILYYSWLFTFNTYISSLFV